MDAVDYLKKSRRMCKSSGGCDTCVAYIDGECCINFGAKSGKEKETVAIVEQWAKDHPVKTRQSEFLKMFPNANLKKITRLLPCSIDSNMNPLRCAKYGYLSITCRCDRCRDDYWNEEVSE